MEIKDNPQPKKRRTLAGKIANVFSYILVSLVFLILLLVLSLQTSPVQNFARGKVENFLEKKLKTRVDIGKLNINFPNSVLLKNVYIEDQTKDTLVSGGLLKVDLSMLKLLKNEIQIKEINVKDITAKIKRVGTDTVFNYQFIVDAFMGDQTKVSEKQDTSTLKMDIDNIIVDNSTWTKAGTGLYPCIHQRTCPGICGGINIFNSVILVRLHIAILCIDAIECS